MAISILTYSSNTKTSDQPWGLNGNAPGWWVIVIHAQAGGQLADMGGDPGAGYNWPAGAWQLLCQVDAGTGLPKVRVWATRLVDNVNRLINLSNAAGVDCHSFVYYLTGVRPGSDASEVFTVGAAASATATTSQAAPLYTPDSSGLLIGAWLSGSLVNYSALGGLTARPEVDGTASTSRAGELALSAAGPAFQTATASAAAPWAAVTIAVRDNIPGAVTFPQTPLKMRTEMALGANPNQDPAMWAGLWTDVTADAKPRDGGVTITRGRADETSTISPSSMTVTLDNTAGKYVRLNPNSPLYGRLDKNTPVQFWVDYGYGWVRRYVGFISEFPPRSLGGEADERMPIEAAGITRRLARGRVLDSPLYRAITHHNVSYTAYWPLETDGSSAIPGIGALRLSGPIEFSNAGPVGSAGEASFPVGTRATSSGLSMRPTTGWQVSFWLDLPANNVNTSAIVGWITPGSLYSEWYAYVNETHPGQVALEVYQRGVAEVFIIGTPDIRGMGPVLVTVIAGQQSGQVYISLSINNVRAASDFTFAPADFVTPITSIGINTLDLPGVAALTGSISHLYITREEPANEGSYGWLLAAGRGHAGEQATNRIRRLASEENVPVAIVGDDGTSEQMGPQPIARFLDIASDVEATDGGVLYERRDGRLAYQPRVGRYNVTPRVMLDYSAGHVAPPLEPTDDDQHVRNDMTVSRVNGGSARVVDQSNVDSVGQYADAADVNVFDDDQLADQAGWRVHLGTADDLRYPAITPNLNGRPNLLLDWAALEIGDPIAITTPGRDLPPGQIDVFAEGYTEQIDTVSWTATANCSPGQPWKVIVLDDSVLGRLDTAGSVVAAPIAAPVLTGNIGEDFESAAANVTIAGAGNLPWVRSNRRSHSGAWSFKSGAIIDAQTSDAIITVPAGRQICTFWCRVSSEQGFDFLRVLVDGIEKFTSTGETGWLKGVVTVAGASIITFRYSKDVGVSAGEDAAFIDELLFTSSETISVVTTSGPSWTVNSSDMPFEVIAGGEQMTVLGNTAVATLNSDPSFNSAAAWSASGGTFTAAGVGQLTPNGTSATVQAFSTPRVAVTAGRGYTASALLQNSVTRSANLVVNWYTAANALISSSTVPVALTANVLTPASLSLVAPAGATLAEIGATMTGTPPATNVLFLDEMSLNSTHTMTVIRASNGVSKAHAVNEDVRLALPPILSE